MTLVHHCISTWNFSEEGQSGEDNKCMMISPEASVRCKVLSKCQLLIGILPFLEHDCKVVSKEETFKSA